VAKRVVPVCFSACRLPPLLCLLWHVSSAAAPGVKRSGAVAAVSLD
jgi:hypothetical protein